MTAISRIKDTKGFSLLEIIVVMGLTVLLLVVGYTALVHTRGGFTQSMNAHQLEMEIGDISDLLGGLLRHAEPRSIVIRSTDMGPWSEIEFAADGHHYHFYSEKGQLLFTVDDKSPKVLSAHLKSAQFALAAPALPTLLTWSVVLGAPSGSLRSSLITTSFSASQYLPEPVE